MLRIWGERSFRRGVWGNREKAWYVPRGYRGRRRKDGRPLSFDNSSQFAGGKNLERGGEITCTGLTRGEPSWAAASEGKINSSRISNFQKNDVKKHTRNTGKQQRDFSLGGSIYWGWNNNLKRD